jgi:hypothetical protein
MRDLRENANGMRNTDCVPARAMTESLDIPIPLSTLSSFQILSACFSDLVLMCRSNTHLHLELDRGFSIMDLIRPYSTQSIHP